jgi:hypothetical protein
MGKGVGRVDDELRLRVSEDGADEERLVLLTGYLRADLLQLDVENVTTLRAGETPPDARAADLAVVGGLLVTLGESAEGLKAVILAIWDWLRRGQGKPRAVRLELDGDELELSQASAADQERLIELFVRRHATAEGGQ